MADTLYYTKLNDPNYQQTLVAAHFLNLNLNPQEINKKYDPLILLTSFGTLNQPNTILLYLLRDQLVGTNEEEKLRVHEWFQHFNLELHPLLKEIYEQISKEKPENKEKYQYSTKELLKVLQIINNHLKTRTFLVGNSISAVDISLTTHLQTAFKSVINQDIRKKLPNLTRWFTYMRSTGPFQKVLGEINLCGKDSHIIADGPAKVQTGV